MRLETHRSILYLTNDTGVLHVPGTLYLNETYTNPHTKRVVAKALRVWIRLADAFNIDLADRAIKGRWLNEVEMKALRYLVFRPIVEIESMSDVAVRTIGSARNEKVPSQQSGAVEPNTALRQLTGIADFLVWFHKKVIEPRMPIGSALTESIRRQVDMCAVEIKKGVRGTKSLHPHRIRSLPTERFLRIYSTVYLQAKDILKTQNRKVGANILRDRAVILLASEGIRPGAIGNIGLADFNWEGKTSPGYVVLKDNTARRNKPLSTSTPVQKGSASSQNYNSAITVAIWPTTAQAIQDYIVSERVAVTTRTLRNRSKGFLFLGSHGGPISDRGTIAHIFRRAASGLATLGLLAKDIADPYVQDESYDFDAYLLRHSAASLFYATKTQTMNSDVVTDLMKMRFGWSLNSDMPNLYAQRAMSNAASVTVEDFMESLLSEAKIIKGNE